MQPAQKRSSRNRITLLIDLAIIVAILVIMAPRSSGIAVHEWLSIAFGAMQVVQSFVIVGVITTFGVLALGRLLRRRPLPAQRQQQPSPEPEIMPRG